MIFTRCGFQQKPRFIRAPASTMEVIEGSQFKLIAKAVGNPKPTVTWKKVVEHLTCARTLFQDGRPILRTNRLYKSTVTGDGESHLIVECVVSKTSGIFSCIAENSFGEEECETQIIVRKSKIKYAWWTITFRKDEGYRSFSWDTCVFTTASRSRNCGWSSSYSQLQGRTHLLDTQRFVDPRSTWAWAQMVLHRWLRRFNLPYICWKWMDRMQRRRSSQSFIFTKRQFQFAELKAERVFKSQQGTYQCIASNSKGEATSQCYLLIGGMNFLSKLYNKV